MLSLKNKTSAQTADGDAPAKPVQQPDADMGAGRYSRRCKILTLAFVVVLAGMVGAVVGGLYVAGVIGPKANASLSLLNATPLQSPSGRRRARDLSGNSNLTPLYVGAKISMVYLVEDVNNATQSNIGQTSMFWINPDCDGTNNGCLPTKISHYFNLSQSTAEIETTLNSEAIGIRPGTYRYVRVEFCNTELASNSNNYQIQATAQTAQFPVTLSECGATTQLPAPLTLAAGDSVVVTLAFDLTSSILVTNVAPTGDSASLCSPQQGDGNYYCFVPIAFTPNAV